MGYASSGGPCGCRQTRLLEPADNIWIEWVRCLKHYRPEVDNDMMRQAEENKRLYDDMVARDDFSNFKQLIKEQP